LQLNVRGLPPFFIHLTFPVPFPPPLPLQGGLFHVLFPLFDPCGFCLSLRFSAASLLGLPVRERLRPLPPFRFGGQIQSPNVQVLPSYDATSWAARGRLCFFRERFELTVPSFPMSGSTSKVQILSFFLGFFSPDVLGPTQPRAYRASLPPFLGKSSPGFFQHPTPAVLEWSWEHFHLYHLSPAMAF